jgi:dTMP kinase
MLKGKLIVIDGTDGSGKATQAELLVKRLRKNKIQAEDLDFPQYETLFGQLVARYLKNEFGRLNPYIASVLYAANRLEFKDKITGWLKSGKTVILNRYVSANQIHQAANIENRFERERFVKWIGQMEYGIFGLPKPDLILFLHIDPVTAHKLVAQKDAKSRKYAAGSKYDVLEADLDHQRKAIQQSLKLLNSEYEWRKIDCMNKTSLLTKEEISDKVWVEVKKLLKLKK